MGPRGSILALPRETAGAAGRGALDVGSLATEVVAVVSRAVARAVRHAIANDEATVTREGRQALARALRTFAYALQDGVGIMATDILRAADALEEGQL